MDPTEWHKHPLTEPQVVETTTEEVVKTYEGWGSDVTSLLSCIKQPTKWNIRVVYPSLNSYAHGRVVLIGDAVSLADEENNIDSELHIEGPCDAAEMLLRAGGEDALQRCM